MTRESWLSKVFFTRDREEGWILVFDKYGHLHHRYEGSIAQFGGPSWFKDSVIITADPGAVITLPTDAVGNGPDRRCF
ncbi:hypothetical protein [Cupriavidus agavae]|uniref:hypothetical protein n=1 Tax=Cupriavidus agavae TaxID=1001822 RepID=UPI00102C0DEC|nr:hypothetical protein [Cupriavidus agavae]